ncbi:MAG: hypothetical protein ACK4NC_01280 [Candidatus Gracilibacteria bacterium]
MQDILSVIKRRALLDKKEFIAKALGLVIFIHQESIDKKILIRTEGNVISIIPFDEERFRSETRNAKKIITVSMIDTQYQVIENVASYYDCIYIMTLLTIAIRLLLWVDRESSNGDIIIETNKGETIANVFLREIPEKYF